MSGSSEMVRTIAVERYVRPALQAGKTQFAVAVKDVLRDLVAKGFPASNIPQVCSALRKREFLRENGIEIEGVDGPPSKQSTTVVYRYRVSTWSAGRAEGAISNDPEDEAVRALRLSRRLRGLLKDELAEYGGGEAFLRWVRGKDEETAA
ncbi:MAG: hypothetical protein P4L40_05600 [Terracidiphilus sp.]|nr:hypothetical protein [Terracidiphilus sp.]